MGTFAYHATNPRISAITGHEVVAGVQEVINLSATILVSKIPRTGIGKK